MTLKAILIAGAALSLTVLATGCQENKFGVVDLTIPETPTEQYVPVNYAYNYDHPCVMWNSDDFSRVKSSLESGKAPQPVMDEFNALKNSSYATKTYQPDPQEWIVRGDATGTIPGKENYSSSMRDAAAAYQLALLWQLTGDADYAKTAVNVLNKWASVNQGVTSNDSNHKLCAVQGYTFAMAAEILRGFNGWSEADFNNFKSWTLKVWAPMARDFMDRHQGVCDDHYWSNWDLVNMCCYMAVGILNDRDDMVNYVVNYFHNGNDQGVKGNGYIGKLIVAYHEDPLGTNERIGQNQESGRDQGHAMMSTAVAAQLAQMAYTLYLCNKDKTELDFFAANDNALMAMGEYVALSNLREGDDQANKNGNWLINTQKIPFETYYYCGGASKEGPECKCTNKSHGATHTAVANDEGRGNLRPGWEIYYMHYSKVKGLSKGFKYAKQAADKMRPECGADGTARYGTNSGAFDQTGWNTLMMYR